MIRLRKISVSGEASSIPFAGTIELGDGAHVFTGPNGYGKSLVCSTVAWCLGIEVMYGVEHGDATIFPESVRHELQLEGAPRASVTQSRAALDLQFSSGSFRFERDIVGGDTKLVTVRFTDEKGKPVERKLRVGHGSFSDETGGLQRMLFELAEMEPPPVVTRHRKQAHLYLENLAPLFIIEQTEGWSDIQALQVLRYGFLEVEQISFEYLLGLAAKLGRRVGRLTAEVLEDELRKDAAEVARQLNQVTKSRGWGEPFPSQNSFANWLERFEGFSFADFLRDKFTWSLDAESAQLQGQLTALRKELSTPPPAPKGSAALGESTNVLDMKDALHRKREELRVLRAQRLEQDRTLQSIEAKLASASDLLRLKKSNIGFPQKSECPTCHTTIDPVHFSLVHQSNEEVERYQAVLESERAAVRSSLDAAHGALEKALVEQGILERSLEDAQRKLASINAAFGPQREEVVLAANKIFEVERKLATEKDLAEAVRRAQVEVDGWAKRAKAFAGLAVVKSSRDDVDRLDAFLKQLRENLQHLGHSAFPALAPEKVVLDEEYVPRAETRRFRGMGSASDRARLVLAYALALQQTALKFKAPHPGLLVVDEPLQQNPDKDHRKKFVDFLASSWKQLEGQAVIFTHLLPDEVTAVKKAGVNVHVFADDEKFLKRLKPPATPPGAAPR